MNNMIRITPRGKEKIFKGKLKDGFFRGQICFEIDKGKTGGDVSIQIGFLDSKGKTFATIDPMDIMFGNNLLLAGIKIKSKLKIRNP